MADILHGFCVINAGERVELIVWLAFVTAHIAIISLFFCLLFFPLIDQDFSCVFDCPACLLCMIKN